MQQPEISVLIPVYNVERYLEECLDSACGQTFADIEIICINDGSTDGSKTIVEKYLQKDSRIKLINKANSGYGASMNRGLDAARGKYVAILESDDFLAANALTTLHKAMLEYDVQVVKSNYFNYWTDSYKPVELIEVVEKEQTNRIVNPQEERFPFHMAPSSWTALFEREFLVDNKIRFLETPGASFQDTSFNFKVWAAATRVVFLYEAFLYYRQDNASSSVNSKEKAFCVCEEYREIAKYLETHPEKEYLKSDCLIKKFSTYLWNYARLGEDLKPLFLERMVEEFSESERKGDLRGLPAYNEVRYDWPVLRDDPQLFLAQIGNVAGGGLLQSLLYYLKIGGFSLAMRAVGRKLRRLSHLLSSRY